LTSSSAVVGRDMKRRTFLTLAAAAGVVASSPVSAQAVSELNFGILSTESQQNLKARFTQFLADMEKSLGIKVNAFFAGDYAGVVEAMRFGKVQVAIYGNAAAIQAVDRASGEVFAQVLEQDGSDGYYSVLIVNKDSKIRDFEDLRRSAGKYTFGNGDPNSTSGFLVPGYYAWALNNIDIRHHFTRIVSGSHEVNALAVANGQVDVATCNSEALRRLEINTPAKREALRVIWQSPLIPLNPLVWRTDLAPEVKQKLTAFLFNYGAEGPGKSPEKLAAERASLEAMKNGRFRASSNKQLIPLRQISLFRERVALEADDKVPAADKAAKLRDIDSKLHQLDRENGVGS
jgi:phosphonate transport system substrate-binding protein